MGEFHGKSLGRGVREGINVERVKITGVIEAILDGIVTVAV